MPADIADIIGRITSRHPDVSVVRLNRVHPADDDGLWFFRLGAVEVQLESSTGECPFVLESNVHDRRTMARSVEEAARLLTEELGLGA